MKKLNDSSNVINIANNETVQEQITPKPNNYKKIQKYELTG